MSLRRVLYSLFLYLIFPLVIIRLFWRSRSNPAYRQRISERLGFVSVKKSKPIIWIHAVSVGETIAAKPLIEALIKDYSDHQILLTTTTPTGSDTVKTLFGHRVAHVYFPYDLPEIVARFISSVKPKLLVIVETEIWPNLYAKCHKEKIPLVLVNARLSDKSTHKYLKIKSLTQETLANVNLICVRSEIDATRFKLLGAKEKQLVVVGNIKFDLEINKHQVEQGKQWRKHWQEKESEALYVWVAASTHAREDEQILAIYENLLGQFPNLKLVLIPRHPERFDDVYLLCSALQTKGIKTLRHSQIEDYKNTQSNIILGDSMGEMQSWFASADVVFMGGSLVETGGHNPIEAIALGVSVVSGPYMFNFEDINSLLVEAGLLSICETSRKVEEQVLSLLKNNNSNIDTKVTRFMQQHQGVTARLVKLISKFI